MTCPCSGSWPAARFVYGPEGPWGQGTLPYQVRPFEPAYMTASNVYTVSPYAPALVAAVSPTFMGPATAVVPGVAADAVAAGDVRLVTPGVPAALGPRCAGCCGTSYSPLPPNAVQAWGSVLGCGGTCATCQWRSV